MIPILFWIGFCTECEELAIVERATNNNVLCPKCNKPSTFMKAVTFEDFDELSDKFHNEMYHRYEMPSSSKGTNELDKCHSCGKEQEHFGVYHDGLPCCDECYCSKCTRVL